MDASELDSVGPRDHDRDWRRRYASLLASVPALAASARPVLAGYSAFVDAYVRLDDAAALFSPDAPEPAVRLAGELVARLRSGTGGEYLIDWPSGDAWLAANLAHSTGAGGTSAQLAKALALLGAPVLLALADRSPAQIDVLSGDILVAERGGPRRLAEVAPDPGHAKARHWIFESTAGAEIAGETVQRSTRVIVRLVDDAPENDPDFAVLSAMMAADCGAAALSSLVSTPDAILPTVLARVAGLARSWRSAGLGLVHIELADYGPRPHLPMRILEALSGIVTSVGMSLSEWKVIGGGQPVESVALADFARRHGLSRLCIHADDFALAVTAGDPKREELALLTGCLLAGARAAAGQPVLPAAVADEAVFSRLPDFGAAAEDFHTIACPAPWLRRPASTIGLGDTFLAGTMLVLSQPLGSGLNDDSFPDHPIKELSI
ncbi:ADP-dependent glucokinase/phosphofructokinase [Kaistia nematophila]|uniref:6-phosphofructokinase n=1 Tax=Kaistia nematophila TaxID=2994654 RepID=A0A9X3E576_9HYPH|nr:ADP-dependent glucokinase/phosphofructokinase [Kaistia nematophila]MCX5571358.1 hypothetical protein [Kaistia nematophila]